MDEIILSGPNGVYGERAESGSGFIFFYFFAEMKWLTTKMNDCFLCELLGSWVDLIELN